MKKRKATTKRKTQQKKIIVTTLAVGATGIIGYFGWQYFKKRNVGKSTDIETLIRNMDQPIVSASVLPVQKSTSNSKSSSGTTMTAALRTDEFPLKKGSKGHNVRRLQEALVAKYGKGALPKYGADGDFGSELAAALKKYSLPALISESTLNVIAQDTTIDAATLGKDLYSAVLAKDFNKALSLIKKLGRVEDYTTANEQFKQFRINGVRQTIVNGLLNTFTTESQKQQIKFEFLRIGLQFDGAKWSLSGFDGLPIVTTISTAVWINATQSVKVPALMVLGNEISKRLDYTLFENGGKHFLVQSKTVKYL